MLYYIGCRIPRGADCEEGWKCRSGAYCTALEVCSMTEEAHEKGHLPFFGYYEKSAGCIFFHTQEQAAEYMETIRSAPY